MTKIEKLYEKADNDKMLLSTLCRIYCCEEDELDGKKARIKKLLDNFREYAPDIDSACIYSAPGRTEIGGNHTDHQRGCVLAAAVDMDALAVAAPNGTDIVRISSEGYPVIEADLSDLSPDPTGEIVSSDIVRGIAAAIKEKGYTPGGFTACVTSNVPGGSGLSSSACFEVLIGTVFNDLFCENALSEMDIARAGNYAENVFCGKPSGMLDQATASVGGLVSMDFSRDDPLIEKIEYDFEANGYVLCVVETGASHADLTAEYASIPEDMKRVAEYFGYEVLSEIDEDDFWWQVGELKEKLGGRAVLRAIHYFDETARALEEADALKKDELGRFLELVNESGRSSENCLQNIYPTGDPNERNMALALEFARRSLDTMGAYRVHGGGFAGTIQAYVPTDMYDGFESSMEMIFGDGCCHRIKVRPVGGSKLI